MLSNAPLDQLSVELPNKLLYILLLNTLWVPFQLLSVLADRSAPVSAQSQYYLSFDQLVIFVQCWFKHAVCCTAYAFVTIRIRFVRIYICVSTFLVGCFHLHTANFFGWWGGADAKGSLFTYNYDLAHSAASSSFTVCR